MFSVQYSSILAHLGDLAYGLQPVHLSLDNRFILIIKIGKEAILTARLNQQIKIYLIPDTTESGQGLGFITAFFDDDDEPIVICTPLYAEDALLIDLISLLGQQTFDIYFFDEHDQELMGVRARNVDVVRFRTAMQETCFPAFDANRITDTYSAMDAWFGLRDAHDDSCSFTIAFIERLYPDDLIIIDARNDAYDFQSVDAIVAATSLEREEPGPFQERDIARLLRRAFPKDAVYLNPTRDDDGTELADVLCITNELILLIQAKDSPNTEACLRRSMDRKRATIRAHIRKAADQLRGALAYVKVRDSIVIRAPIGVRALPVADRMLCGLVVVREMFDDDYASCSVPVLTVAAATEVPCVLLGYATLHAMTLYLPAPMRLFNGFLQLFDAASHYGEYPKPRFLGKPA